MTNKKGCRLYDTPNDTRKWSRDRLPHGRFEVLYSYSVVFSQRYVADDSVAEFVLLLVSLFASGFAASFFASPLAPLSSLEPLLEPLLERL